ncbi:hypothetical protein PRIPAC_72535, partial [Pristionchus pacificus]
FVVTPFITIRHGVRHDPSRNSSDERKTLVTLNSVHPESDGDVSECSVSSAEGKPLVPTAADIVKRKEKEWKQNKKDKEIEAKKKLMVKKEGESDNWYDDFFNHV